MIERDSGHKYLLRVFDDPDVLHAELTFMKREGHGYPGNQGHYGGTNCQEVLRALISRILYLDSQIPCDNNRRIVQNLRESLLLLEQRAADRHHRMLSPLSGGIETYLFCSICGHIGCNQH